MSLEVFGDEGNVPSTWEDTAMRQEFDRVVAAWAKWRRDFKHEVPGPDHEEAIQAVEDALDNLSDGMSGRLD